MDSFFAVTVLVFDIVPSKNNVSEQKMDENSNILTARMFPLSHSGKG